MGTLSLEDQLQIQDLYARYNHAADHAAGSDWVATFTRDGVFGIPGRDPVVGVDALLAVGNAFKPGTMRHVTSNLVLEPTANGAIGRAYLVLHSVGGGNPSTIARTGEYEDVLVKGAGGWRFAKRDVTFD